MTSDLVSYAIGLIWFALSMFFGGVIGARIGRARRAVSVDPEVKEPTS